VQSTARLWERDLQEVEIQDKVIIIGAGYSETEDKHRTALSSKYLAFGAEARPLIFGAELQAYATTSILAAMEPRSAPPAEASAPSRRGYLELPTGRIWLWLLIAALVAGVLRLWTLLWVAIRKGRRKGKTPPSPRELFFVLWIPAFIALLIYWAWALTLFTANKTWLPLLRPTALLILLTSLLSWSMRGAADAEKPPIDWNA
jgi:CHASE2 domain-containing sensor protein